MLPIFLFIFRLIFQYIDNIIMFFYTAVYLINMIFFFSSYNSLGSATALKSTAIDDVLARQDMRVKNRESNRGLSNSAARFRSPVRATPSCDRQMKWNPALFRPAE